MIDMDEQTVLEALKPLIAEVTRVELETIRMESGLMTDLGAASLDLLDLSFLIEERFDIRLEADEFTSHAQARLPDGVYEFNGYLTEAALGALRELMPEVPPEKLRSPMRRTEIPSVLTVGVFVHLIQRKLNAR